MYKLILVDDESIVRETISRLIRWEQYDIDLIGSCSNAMEAMEVISEQRPDIVITDIKMPVMNGIELIRQVKAQGISSEFIILSGYNEFEFAKKAMQENVRHYILKPCSENEIEEVLVEVISDLEAHRKVTKNMEAHKLFQHTYLQQFIDLVLQNREVNDEMKNCMNMLFSEQDQLFWVSFQCALDLQNVEGIYESFRDFSHSAPSLLISSVIKINNTLGGFYFSSGQELPLEQLTLLQKRLFEKLHKMPVLNSVVQCDPRNLYTLIQDICEGSVGCMIITPEGMKPCKTREAACEAEVASLQEHFERCIAKCDEQNVLASVQSLFYAHDRNLAMMVCTKILMKYFCAGLLEPTHLIQILDEIYATKEPDISIEEICKKISGLIHINKKNKNFVDTIINYIHAHMDDSRISLKWCAKELVFLNEDYISRAFVKQTGENFNTYFNRKRIERAKFLLSVMGEDDRIYIVAEQIGLGHNPRYFSKLFRKYTGYTPKEYKCLYN